MVTREDALKICETVLSHARAAGAEDATVSVRAAQQSHARFADNRITTSGRADDLQVTATVWAARKRGTSVGNDSSEAALKQLGEEAVQIAKVSPTHREYLPTLGPHAYGEHRGYSAATANVDLIARARTLNAVLATCRAAKVVGAGFHTASEQAIAEATANGNRRYFRSTHADFSVTARAADGTGSGYFSSDHFDLSKLDAQHVVEQAVNKAVRSRQPKPIEPGTYPVILEAQAVADLMGFLTNALDARNTDEGRSAFSGRDGKSRVGERMFAETLTIYSDPMHPELPAVPATTEGIPATRLPLIANGVLENLSYSRFWAQEKKKAPTAGPVNFIIEGTGAPASIDEMVTGMARGLLISRFWYVRLIDGRSLMLTGLTRDGMWWVEKGQVRHPVMNLRFNQSVLAMLAPWNVEAIGRPERKAPLMVPALKLAGFTFTSTSDAI
jgi:predicted Zn-dependent protease